MDLMCPHCQRRVTVSDDKAGQVASCPLCTKQFMAPSLPPAPVPMKPAAPPAPSSESYSLGPAPAPILAAPSAPAPEPQPAAPPPPPVPPGEYTHSFHATLCDKWLVFVAPACVAAIFVLSFFSWHSFGDPLNLISVHVSLWVLSFTEHGYFRFLAYTLLMMPTSALVIVNLLFDKAWLHTPPQLAPVMLWKNLAAGALLAFTFLFLCFDYGQMHFLANTNPIAVPMKLAIRLQLIAALASFSMFWLHWRKRKNLPLPKIEVRW